MRILATSLDMLLQLRTSYVITTESIHILLHIPVTYSPSLTAYEYIPTPLTHPSHNKPYLFNPVNKLLLVDPSSTQYVEKQSLQTCSTYLETKYFCPDIALLRNSPMDSCLLALFRSDTKRITTSCPTTSFNGSFFAAEFNQNKFFVYAESQSIGAVVCPSTATIHRTDSTSQTRRLLPAHTHHMPLPANSSIITIPQYCHIRLLTLSLYPRSTVNTDNLVAIPLNPSFFSTTAPTSIYDDMSQKYGNLILTHARNTVNTPAGQLLIFVIVTAILSTIYACFIVGTSCIKHSRSTFMFRRIWLSVFSFFLSPLFRPPCGSRSLHLLSAPTARLPIPGRSASSILYRTKFWDDYLSIRPTTIKHLRMLTTYNCSRPRKSGRDQLVSHQNEQAVTNSAVTSPKKGGVGGGGGIKDCKEERTL